MAPPKPKGQKMGLGEFLTDASLGSWADEMEDAPMPFGRSNYSFDRSQGPGGPSFSSFTDRGYSTREQVPLPTKPPFTVHIGNLSFDSTEGDILDFFSGCQVTSVRIVEDKLDRRPKGFAYAEFETLDGLKKALDMSGTQFQGRNVRISTAEPQKERNEAKDMDWTRKGPLPDAPRRGGPDRPSFQSRQGEPFGDAGADRPGRRFGFEPASDGKSRDFSNWERKGPPAPMAPTSAAPRQSLDRPTSREGFRERRNSPAWGEGRSQDGGSRPPRREFVERPAPERAPTAAELDTQWRSKMRPDPPAAPAAAAPTSQASSVKEASQNNSPTSSTAGGPAPAKLTTRPKLNLQKRTVSSAQGDSPVQASAADPKVSPFGAARPIDTAAREKEVEQKLRQRKEQEERQREEKRAAEDKAKEERRTATQDRPDKSKARANGNAKDGEAAAAPSKKYEILRRDTGDEKSNAAADKTTDPEAPNGLHPQDANTANKATGSAAAPSGEPAAEATSPPVPADEDGWSTVPAKPTKNRRGPSARAGA